MEKVLAVFGLIGIIAVPVGLIWLVYSFVKRKKKLIPILTIILGIFVFALTATVLPDSESAETATTTTTKSSGSDDIEEVEDTDFNEDTDYIDYNDVNEANYDEISYDDLARDPDEHEGDMVTLSGTIIQVIEDDKYPEYRLAVDDNYDNIVLIEIPKKIMESRVLENDEITIYGQSAGTFDYESTSGEQVTVPAVAVHKYETQ